MGSPRRKPQPAVREGKSGSMAQDNKNNNKKSQFQQPSPRTTIISVVLFLIVAFFVGQQFMNMSSTTQMCIRDRYGYAFRCVYYSVAFRDDDRRVRK